MEEVFQASVPGCEKVAHGTIDPSSLEAVRRMFALMRSALMRFARSVRRVRTACFVSVSNHEPRLQCSANFDYRDRILARCGVHGLGICGGDQNARWRLVEQGEFRRKIRLKIDSCAN